MILIDSNVLIDVFSRDPVWMVWSRRAIGEYSDRDQLVVNHIVIAEVAPRFAQLRNFLDWIGTFDVGLAELDGDAAFCAGVAFVEFRRRRRSATEPAKSIIADFLIGGQAQVLGAAILTRDPRFYRTYFPSVPLITPGKAET